MREKGVICVIRGVDCSGHKECRLEFPSREPTNKLQLPYLGTNCDFPLGLLPAGDWVGQASRLGPLLSSRQLMPGDSLPPNWPTEAFL